MALSAYADKVRVKNKELVERYYHIISDTAY